MPRAAPKDVGYAYIERAYGLTFTPGERVRHTESAQVGLGTVRKVKQSHAHYVMVLFDGRKHADPCHPQALEKVAPEGRSHAS